VIGRHPTATHYILREGHGFSPKIGILTDMLSEVGISLHWAKIPDWQPFHRDYAARHGAGVRTKPITRMRLNKPHPLVLEVRDRRMELDMTCAEVEAMTDLTAGSISDIETGHVVSPHITTMQSFASAVGLRLIYREM
jgi:hypothetical protein